MNLRESSYSDVTKRFERHSPVSQKLRNPKLAQLLSLTIHAIAARKSGVRLYKSWSVVVATPPFSYFQQSLSEASDCHLKLISLRPQKAPQAKPSTMSPKTLQSKHSDTSGVKKSQKKGVARKVKVRVCYCITVDVVSANSYQHHRKVATIKEVTRKAQDSRLLNLPAENRNSVYELVLRDDQTIQVDQDLVEPGLFATCSQIRHEATSIWYRDNSFDANVYDCDAAVLNGWAQHCCTVGQRDF